MITNDYKSKVQAKKMTVKILKTLNLRYDTET